MVEPPSSSKSGGERYPGGRCPAEATEIAELSPRWPHGPPLGEHNDMAKSNARRFPYMRMFSPAASDPHVNALLVS
ncbi:MAG: hypothetical protein AB7O38_10885 [Pirellulaceae bacterium]